MAPASPALMATRSKSALLPMTLERNSQGQWVWNADIPVESNVLRFAIVSSGRQPGSTLPLNVAIADRITNRLQSAAALGAGPRQSTFGPPDSNVPADYYELTDLIPGDVRQIQVASVEPAQGFLLIEGGGSARLVSHQTALNQRVGQRIALVASVDNGDQPANASGPVRVTRAQLLVTRPDGQVLTIPMFDDGLHQDGQAGDGVYGADFVADRQGTFSAQIIVSGQQSDGSSFIRTAEHLIPIVNDTVTLQPQAAQSRMVSSRRLEISLGVSAQPTWDHYRVFAEVWGTPASGGDVSVPVSWIGGMTAIRDGALRLGLDTRWIARSGAQAPFELRNVRIEEPDYFITLASAERLPLTIPALPSVNMAADQAVDDEMRMGPRPESLAHDPEAFTAGTGHVLLLVHGYCSSDVWGSANNLDFTNASVFLDLNKNRTHDAFALLIQQWGLPWNSYAIVAHSQGGAAALHLSTYYWSGLDNAGPGRLIQSVGTPYQGTPLANFSGFSCGANYDMTPTGAAAWLAGIPTVNRSKVNFFTTSFTSGYCDALANFFLADPNDGVIEQVRGQLPGGVNQGHKTGWCHTTGMAYPAQYLDHTRNAEMNANKAVAPNLPPSADSVTPSSGSGASQTFTYVFSDPDGFADIAATLMLVNTSSSPVNGCYVAYAPKPKLLFLANDAATAAAGPVTAGTPTTLENSQCILDAAASSSSGNGTTLTVTLALSFKAGFTGAKNTYMEAIDRTNPAPPLTQMGTWTVTNEGPAAVSVTPASGSGSSQTFSFVFSDPNGYADIVSTQMLVNAAPSAANGCYVAFSPAGSQFYLVNDAGNGVLGPVTAGTATTLQNSRCILNAATSSASGAGTQLTVNAALSFKPAFAGSKNIYMQASDSLNQTFALVAKGTFIVN